MTGHCWLCTQNRFDLNDQLELPSEDTLIRQTEWSISAMDIAALVEGHILITPIRHVKRLSDLDADEAYDIQQQLTYFKDIFGSVGLGMLAFEHCDGGSTKRNCVSHAHVHCFPISSDRLRSVTAVLSQIKTTGTQNSNYLKVFFADTVHIVNGTLQSEKVRSALELAVADDCRPWRSRLQQDIDALPSKLTKSIHFIQKLQSADTI